MSKNTNEQQSAEVVDNITQPETTAAIAEELEQNGTVVLCAPTTEALSELLNSIPAGCRYRSGAIGRKREDGSYTLRIDKIINQ